MSTAHSTYPAFATPTPSGDAAWFKQRFAESSTLTKPVTLKSGAMVPIPLLFWDARALCIEGHADADAVDLLLRDQGLRAAREWDRALVQIWAPDYGGTTLGPHKAVYALVWIEPPRECRKEEEEQLARRPSWREYAMGNADGAGDRVDHWAFLWYYGTSPVNQEFVRDVWGIPNEPATIETSYLADVRGLRLLEDGGVALRLRIARRAGRVPQRAPVSSLFRTIARRAHDTGENWVEVNVRGAVEEGPIARDDGKFQLRKDSRIEKQLTRVSFEPARWRFFDGYEGIVEIWDEKGSGKDPVQDTDDRYEVVKKGDAWLIREFREFPQ